MTILAGIGIGIFICYWVKTNAQAKQELLYKHAHLEIMTQLAREARAANGLNEEVK